MADDDKTFTQADVDRIVRERIAREREKFSDYDELKKAAETAGKDKSQIEKLTQSIEALTQRAEKADHELARRDVAAEFGLTAREAKRLSGKTLDELRADAREMVEDLGIDVEARKKGATTATKESTTEGEEAEGASDTSRDEEKPSTSTARPAGRPKETLRSGSPSTTAKPEETDPMKLADAIMGARG
jgi:hypothetical protein